MSVKTRDALLHSQLQEGLTESSSNQPRMTRHTRREQYMRHSGGTAPVTAPLHDTPDERETSAHSNRKRGLHQMLQRPKSATTAKKKFMLLRTVWQRVELQLGTTVSSRAEGKWCKASLD